MKTSNVCSIENFDQESRFIAPIFIITCELHLLFLLNTNSGPAQRLMK